MLFLLLNEIKLMTIIFYFTIYVVYLTSAIGRFYTVFYIIQIDLPHSYFW